MPQDRLEQKLRQLGLSHPTANAKRLTFRLYFPRPPYGPVEYLAAKQGDGLNFVGQLLGHGGCTLKKIQTDSGARVEVHDGKGNLNGTHPSYTDPSLHAVVFAETREKLTKAARMIAEVLQPIGTSFEKFEVTPGGSALLKPNLPKKAKSPRSESSSRSQRAWGGASTPSSENDSCAAHVTDIDSAYVQENNTPWKSVTSLHGSTLNPQSCAVKPSEKKPAEKEATLAGWKEWKTWGSGNSDCYSQFTALTQNLVSQYASRSREVPSFERPSYFESFQSPTVWNPASSKLNGSNINSSFSQYRLSPGLEFPRPGIWKKESRVDEMDGYPLPYVYEDLIGVTPGLNGTQPPVEESRLTNAYQISLETERVTQKGICPRMALPHDL